MRKIITALMVIIIIAIGILIVSLIAPEPGNLSSWLRRGTETATPLPTLTPVPTIIPGVARLAAIEGAGEVKVGAFTYQADSFGLSGWPVIPHDSLITTSIQNQLEIEVGLRSQEPAGVLICPESSMLLTYGRNNIATVLTRGFFTITQSKSLAMVSVQAESSTQVVNLSIQAGELVTGIDPTRANIIWVYCVTGQCQREDKVNGTVILLPGHVLAIDVSSGRMTVPTMVTAASLSTESRCEIVDVLLASVNAGELSALAYTPTPMMTETPVIKTFSIWGKVTDSLTGEIIEGVRILMNGPVWIDTFTDSAGFFMISGLQAGNYTLMTARGGYVAQARFLNLSDQDIADIELSLSPPSLQTYTMTVTVTLEGLALPGVFILASGDLRGKFGCITETDGKCTLTGLRNDRYEVSGIKEGYTIDAQVVYLLENDPVVALIATHIK